MTSWTVACQTPLSVNPPGKNTGVGRHSLLQGSFLTQQSNLGLLHCHQADSLPFEPSDYLGGPILITGVFKDCQKAISQQKKGQRDMSLLSLKMDEGTISQGIQVFFKKLKRRKQIIHYSP